MGPLIVILVVAALFVTGWWFARKRRRREAWRARLEAELETADGERARAIRRILKAEARHDAQSRRELEFLRRHGGD
jgi:hypothetical protein